MRGDGQGSNAPPQPRRDPSENRHRDATEGGAHERRSMRASPAPGIPGLFFTVLRRRTHADAHGAHAGAPGAPVSRVGVPCGVSRCGIAPAEGRARARASFSFHFSHTSIFYNMRAPRRSARMRGRDGRRSRRRETRRGDTRDGPVSEPRRRRGRPRAPRTRPHARPRRTRQNKRRSSQMPPQL